MKKALLAVAIAATFSSAWACNNVRWCPAPYGSGSVPCGCNDAPSKEARADQQRHGEKETPQSAQNDGDRGNNKADSQK